MLVHEPTGWGVDPETGIVYGGRWASNPIGWVASNGYLHSAASGRRCFLLHRVVWEAANGPIPPGLEINHKNANKTDNRLANLELVTPSGNRRHAYEMGLLPKPPTMRGLAHPASKVTREQSSAIRTALAGGETQRQVAARFGISQRTVWCIARGEHWTLRPSQ